MFVVKKKLDLNFVFLALKPGPTQGLPPSGKQAFRLLAGFAFQWTNSGTTTHTLTCQDKIRACHPAMDVPRNSVKELSGGCSQSVRTEGIHFLASFQFDPSKMA